MEWLIITASLNTLWASVVPNTMLLDLARPPSLLVLNSRHTPAGRETQDKPQIPKSWKGFSPTKLTAHICTTLAARPSRKTQSNTRCISKHLGPVPSNPAQAPIHKQAVSAEKLLTASTSLQRAYRTSRMSSKCTVPVPPVGTGAPLVPKPRVMLPTFVRSVP